MNEPKHYKRVEHVTAIQWTGENDDAVAMFVSGLCGGSSTWRSEGFLKVRDGFGTFHLSPGHWVMDTENGLQVMSDEEFRKECTEVAR